MPRILEQVSPLDQQLVKAFAERVRGRFGDRVLGMKVFGSRARGEARPDSDLDIWVLLDDASPGERACICDIATDLLFEVGMPYVISPRVMSREQHERLTSLERLLPREIEQDGIPA